MNILLTVHQFFPQFAAGTEILTRSVARELIRRGHTVRVFAGHPASAELREEDRFDQYDFQGIHVYRFHHAYTAMGGQQSMIEVGYDNQLASTYFQRILVAFQPDVVHFFHLDRLGTGLIELAVRAGVPAFMTPTDFWAICPTAQLVLCNGRCCQGPSEYAGNCVKHLAQSTQKKLTGLLARLFPAALADLLARLTQRNLMPPYPHRSEVKAVSHRLPTNVVRLNQLTKIVSPNQFMREKLVQYGVLPHLVTEASFGIDLGTHAGNTLRRSPRKPFRVGFIGTLGPHKGCHILIKAFKFLPPGSAILRIYGNQEDFPGYSSKLRQMAAYHKRIEFCGVFPNSKISEVLSDLDALVVPSLWYENTPLVVYSAQAARCPVVASDFPGISEVVQHETNGLLFEAGHPEALASQLSRLMDEPGFAERLSVNSQPPKSTSRYVDEMLDLWESA